MRPLMTCLAMVTLLCLPLFAVANDNDGHGSKDHPLVSRFAGAYIRDYSVFDFDAVKIPLGPVPEYKDHKLEGSAKVVRVEGKVTNITYVLPEHKSPLEVTRNYESALAKGHLQTVYGCQGEACGGGMYWLMNHDQPSQFGSTICGVMRDGSAAYVARTAPPAPEAHVFIYICSNGSGSQIVVRERIVEARAMDQGQVTVHDAAYLDQQLARDGHVVVDGIYFDTASAVVKPESKMALDAMADALRQHPALKVYIVGHTDNHGSDVSNLQLSKSRAQAVVESLVKTYGIAQERVQARGVASLSPVDSNRGEAGRAKNRRVEMVEQ